MIDAYSWALTCETNIFPLCVHSPMSIHMPLLQIFLFLILQSFSSGPPPTSQATHHCPWVHICCNLGPFSFRTKWMTRCTSQSSSCWWDFPSPLFFKASSERDCNTATTHFQLVPTYWSDPPMSPVYSFSSSFCWLYGIPLTQPQV